MRALILVHIALVLALVVTAPMSTASSLDPETSQLGGVLMLRGPGPDLGATVRDITAAELERHGILSGVLIEEVRPNSPASRAGLKKGDVVVEFDDEEVRNFQQFKLLAQFTWPGSTVEATIVRDGIKSKVSLAMVGDP